VYSLEGELVRLTSNKVLQSFLLRLSKISHFHQIFIYGIGSFGTFWARCLIKHNIKFDGFIETSINDIENETYMGKKVYCISDIPLTGWFLISSLRYKDEMVKNLMSRGVPEERIISFPDYTMICDVIVDVLEPQQYSAKIRRFKNIHQGERCFIIGNGPSLQIKDLENLRGSITMCCNNMFQVFDKTAWRPTYYFVSDLDLSKKLFPKKANIAFLCSCCKAVFTGIWGNLYQYRDDPNLSNLYFFTERLLWDDRPPFSEDVSEVTYGCYTVIYNMLQFAAYMGFREIFLIGVDHNFTSIVRDDGSVLKFNQIERNHAEFMDDHQPEDIVKFPHVEKMEKAYLAARDYAQANGIKIYNATRGGKLEIFERVDFDRLFQ